MQCSPQAADTGFLERRRGAVVWVCLVRAADLFLLPPALAFEVGLAAFEDFCAFGLAASLAGLRRAGLGFVVEAV